MSKVKNRDRAKPKSALNITEHRAGVSPNPMMSPNEQMQSEQMHGDSMHGDTMHGEKMHADKMHAAPSGPARKKEKRLGHN